MKIVRYFGNVNSIQVVLKVTRDLRWHSSRKLLSSSSVARINRRKLVSVIFNIGYGVKLNKPKDWNVNHLATISPATAVRKGRTLDKKLSSIQTIPSSTSGRSRGFEQFYDKTTAEYCKVTMWINVIHVHARILRNSRSAGQPVFVKGVDTLVTVECIGVQRVHLNKFIQRATPMSILWASPKTDIRGGVEVR